MAQDYYITLHRARIYYPMGIERRIGIVISQEDAAQLVMTLLRVFAHAGDMRAARMLDALSAPQDKAAQ